MRFVTSIFLFASVVTGTSAIGTPCEIDAIRPSSLFAKLNDELTAQGLYQLPASMAADDTVGALFRGNEIVAHVKYARDATADSEDLSVIGNGGEILFKATQRVTDASGALTTTIEITPAREGSASSAATPYRISFSVPDDHLSAEIYDNDVTFFQFHTALVDSLAWLTNTLVEATNGQAVTYANAYDRLLFVLAQDGAVLPYIEGVHLEFDRTGGMVLSGVVPSNAIHDRILDAISAQDVVIHGDLIVIDTRTRLPLSGPGAFDVCRHQ